MNGINDSSIPKNSQIRNQAFVDWGKAAWLNKLPQREYTERPTL